MIFDYFYKEQSEQYAFYRIPKVLIVDEEFADLSTDAKLLYTCVIDGKVSHLYYEDNNMWFVEGR